MTNDATPSEAGANRWLGPALEEAAYDCMSALSGVNTYEVNLRDHPDAWAAVEAFAAKVQAAERALMVQGQTYPAHQLRQAIKEIKDAARYRWLRDNPTWSVGYRLKQGKREWRMRQEGEFWGQWWPTHEQAVDHAMAAARPADAQRWS